MVAMTGVLPDHTVNSRGFREALALSLVSLLWSTALITNFGFDLISPEKFGMVFNDMAQRLLRGDMTIDSHLIDFEAFVRDGRTYTYFGISRLCCAFQQFSPVPPRTRWREFPA